MTDVLLEARDVRVCYGTRTVLDGVSLSLRAGERVALVGRNGAGKSSLLRVLAGVQRAAGGRVEVGGADIASLPRPLAAQRVGWMAQVVEATLPFRARELAGFGLEARGAGATDAPHATVQRALEQLGIGHLAETSVLALSGGERQRVRFAATLLQAARVSLYDEPTSAQDAEGIVRMNAAWRAQADAGGAVLVALHDLTTAARAFGRVVVLDDAQVLADGAPAEVFRSVAFREAWGHAVDVHVGADGRVWVAPDV